LASFVIGLEWNKKNKKKDQFQSRLYSIELHLVCLYVNVKLLNIRTRHELCLQEKMTLIKEKENGLCH
jgi:hypothetical protein